MKEKPSEWIAISDLMAGVMAVMMLLLVLAIMQKGASELKYKLELEQSKVQRVDPLKDISLKIKKILNTGNANELIEMDLAHSRLTLRDSVFQKGSACLTEEAKIAVQSVQQQLESFLKEHERSKILVEGYTDNLPVNHPVTDFRRFCTVYDDNYTLSAARAREARKAIVGTMDEATARRIIVAGFGDSSPLPGIDPADARNRRVEVQLTLK